MAKKSTQFAKPVNRAVLAAVFTAIPLIGFSVLMFSIAMFFLGNKIANDVKLISSGIAATTKNQVAYELFMKHMMANVYHTFWAGLTALVVWFCFSNQAGWLFNTKWSIIYAVSYMVIAPTLTFLTCKKIRNS